jgi:hypothetical protein
MSSSLAAVWDFRDAWILQAIVYAGRKGDLRSVIAAADMINVDIPSRDDLERSVNRLAAAGLVNPAGTAVPATRSGRRLVRTAGGLRTGARELPPLIEAELQRLTGPVGEAHWSLAQNDWQDAYDRYYPPEERERS